MRPIRQENLKKQKEVNAVDMRTVRFVIEKLVDEVNDLALGNGALATLYPEEVVEINEAIKSLGIDCEVAED